jgi:Na+/H+-dicarboxylate symporter
MPKPSLSVTILLGLLAGLALGLAASATGAPLLMRVALGVEPAGTIWINLLRMCVVPLVAAALVSGVGSLGDPRRLGRVGLRTFGFIFATILLAALTGLVLALLAAPIAPASPAAAAALRAAALQGSQDVAQQVGRVQGLREFILELVPANPVRSAADGALLPLTVFSVLLGAAVGALAEPSRRVILGFTDAVVAALIKLVGWGMLLAPLGVLCLAAPVAARLGWETLRGLAVFVVTIVAGTTLFALLVYGAAAKVLARVRVGPFARTIAPGAAVAFTTASSMAALPTMMDTALEDLHISKGVASFVLPLAATLNRPGSAIYQMAAVVFVGSLWNVTLGPGQIAAAFATCFLMTFSVAAMPSSTVFTTAPVLLAAGLPVESIALLLGVDRIPDMFRTGLNGIAHQTAVAVVARAEGETIA